MYKTQFNYNEVNRAFPALRGSRYPQRHSIASVCIAAVLPSYREERGKLGYIIKTFSDNYEKERRHYSRPRREVPVSIKLI